jgi:hypothetical protein
MDEMQLCPESVSQQFCVAQRIERLRRKIDRHQEAAQAGRLLIPRLGIFFAADSLAWAFCFWDGATFVFPACDPTINFHGRYSIDALTLTPHPTINQFFLAKEMIAFRYRLFDAGHLRCG